MHSNFDIKYFHGLSERGAMTRLSEEVYNELPSAKRRSVFAIAFSVVREPMLLLLVGGGVFYFLLGDVEEALMLLGFVFAVMGITFYQERKSERALEALRDLSSPRALVIRESVEKRIAGREVVRDDILDIMAVSRKQETCPLQTWVILGTNSNQYRATTKEAGHE